MRGYISSKGGLAPKGLCIFGGVLFFTALSQQSISFTKANRFAASPALVNRFEGVRNLVKIWALLANWLCGFGADYPLKTPSKWIKSWIKPEINGLNKGLSSAFQLIIRQYSCFFSPFLLPFFVSSAGGGGGQIKPPPPLYTNRFQAWKIFQKEGHSYA